MAKFWMEFECNATEKELEGLAEDLKVILADENYDIYNLILDGIVYKKL